MFFAVIEGDPVPKKATRCSCIHGKPKLYHPTSEYQKKVKKIFERAAGFYPPYSCPIEMNTKIFLPIPSSCSKVKKKKMMEGEILPDKKPDDDNIAYLISNAASGVFYDDDRRRCKYTITKHYDDGNGPRVEVTVNKVGKDER